MKEKGMEEIKILMSCVVIRATRYLLLCAAYFFRFEMAYQSIPTNIGT